MLSSSPYEAKAVEIRTASPLSSSIHAPSTMHKHTILPSSTSTQSNNSSSITSSCINYDPSLRTITVTCGSTRLTDIYKKLHDSKVLAKQSPDGVWLLKANLVIAKEATLHINSNDTKWLKISSTGLASIPNSIDVHGTLKIDSIRITSWDPVIGNYAITNGSRQEAPVGSKGVTANGYIIHLGVPRA